MLIGIGIGLIGGFVIGLTVGFRWGFVSCHRKITGELRQSIKRASSPKWLGNRNRVNRRTGR